MDRELLLRARAGDVEAFESIVLAKGESLFRTALAILGNEADARDAVQETFVRSWRSMASLRAVLRFYRATPDLGAVTLRDAAALSEVNPPTIVIWGEGDPYIPVRYAEVQREYFPRAEIAVLPKSGHGPFVDDPDGVADALIPFLKEQLSA